MKHQSVGYFVHQSSKCAQWTHSYISSHKVLWLPILQWRETWNYTNSSVYTEQRQKVRATFVFFPFSSQVSSLKMNPTERASMSLFKEQDGGSMCSAALIPCQPSGSQTEHFNDGSDGKYEHLQGGSQQQAAKTLVHFLPQQLVNQSTVFFMLVWHVTTRDLEVEFYTEAINRVFFQHRLIFCQALIISPVSCFHSQHCAWKSSNRIYG